MTRYRKILVALNSNKDNAARTLIHKAVEWSDPDRIHIIHIEPHPVAGVGDLTKSDNLTNEIYIRQQALSRLSDLAATFSIPASNLHIAFGNPVTELRRHTESLDCGLLIIGHHPESGIHALFHTTASDIVSHTQADTLVIHL